MSEPVRISVYGESYYYQRDEKTGEIVSFRIVRKSLLPIIEATQSKKTYDYALKLFKELDKREKEVKKAQQGVIAVNTILQRLLNKTLNMKDGS